MSRSLSSTVKVIASLYCDSWMSGPSHRKWRKCKED